MNEENYGHRLSVAAQALGLATEPFQKLFDERIGLDSTTDLDDDNVFKFGDFMKKFEDYPIGKVRKAYGALRGGKIEKLEHTGTGTVTDERQLLLKSLGLKVRLEDADPATLLPHYLPGKPSDPITTALKKRFEDKAVIVFRADGSVAVTESVQYMADLEQHFPEQTAIMVDGQLAQLYPVGVKPDHMVEEDPLFPGRPLRNGYSTVNNRNWTNISHEQRQLCRIIVQRGDIDPNNKEAVLRLLERAETKDGLPAAYPEACLDFRLAERKDQLPRLKVELGGTKPNNPFGVRRQY